MQLHEVADDGQAEARASRLARPRLVDAIEPLEDAGQFGLGDAVARVGDRQPDVAGIRRGREVDAAAFRACRRRRSPRGCATRRASWPGRSGSSGPAASRQMPTDCPRASVSGCRSPATALKRPSTDTSASSSGSWPASRRARRSRSFTSRSMRAGVPRDDLEEPRGLGLVRGTVEQGLDIAANRGQGRAEFVRDVGHEVAPDAVCSPQIRDVVEHEHGPATAGRDRRRAPRDERLPGVAADDEFEPARPLALQRLA